MTDRQHHNLYFFHEVTSLQSEDPSRWTKFRLQFLCQSPRKDDRLNKPDSWRIAKFRLQEGIQFSDPNRLKRLDVKKVGCVRHLSDDAACCCDAVGRMEVKCSSSVLTWRISRPAVRSSAGETEVLAAKGKRHQKVNLTRGDPRSLARTEGLVLIVLIWCFFPVTCVRSCFGWGKREKMRRTVASGQDAWEMQFLSPSRSA